MTALHFYLVIFFTSGLLISGVSSDQNSSPPGNFSIQITGIESGSYIPNEFTCKGQGNMPDIRWNNTPEGTASMIFILDDPDAPNGVFTHWIVYNITKDLSSFSPDKVQGAKILKIINQGKNSAGTEGYFPPCPPKDQTHRYTFTLYALDISLDFTSGDREEIMKKMDGHIINTANLTAYFG